MIKLYDNAFSPFARKVRIALELKGLAFEVLDGLMLANRDALAKVNGRVEVPAIAGEKPPAQLVVRLEVVAVRAGPTIARDQQVAVR